MTAGSAALLVNINMVPDVKRIQAGSASPQSINQNPEDNFRLKGKNLKFLFFMGAAGFITLIISYFFRINGL